MRRRARAPRDDGRVIAPMDGPGMPFGPAEERAEASTRGERRAMMQALWGFLLPLTLGFIGALALVLLLLDRFWLA